MILHQDRSTHAPRFFPGSCGCNCPAAEPQVYYYTDRISFPCCSVTFPRTLTATARVLSGSCSPFGGPHTSRLTWGDSAINLPVCGSTGAFSQGGWKGTFTTTDGNSWEFGLFCLQTGFITEFRAYLYSNGANIWCRPTHTVGVLSSSNPCNSPLFISFTLGTGTPFECLFISTCGVIRQAYCGASASIIVEVTE